jgi:hypothetical protein
MAPWRTAHAPLRTFPMEKAVMMALALVRVALANLPPEE